MKVDFTGRGVDLTDQIRSFTQSKLERLNRHLEDIRDVHVVLSTEKYRHKAEIKFLSGKRSYHGTEETSEMFQSIDRVIDKVESQVKKHKDKLHSRKRNATQSIRINVIDNTPEPEPAAKDKRELRIIHTDHSAVKPMSLDEAVDELVKLNQEFIIYRNSETDRINVVYHRRDGNIGYIEPGN